METTPRITVQTTVAAPAARVWDFYTGPEHIVHWNAASADWHTPRAENDVRVGGRFVHHMAARDGSVGFDFEGTYTQVVLQQLLAYTMPDGRRVETTFEEDGGVTKVTTVFDTDGQHPEELQQQGWQAILDNFKAYAEAR